MHPSFGPNHEHSLSVVVGFANAFQNQREFEESKKLYERALLEFESNPLYGPNHINTLLNVMNLAKVLHELSKGGGKETV